MDSTGIDGWTGVHLTRQRSAVMYHMYIAYARLLPTAMTYFTLFTSFRHKNLTPHAL